MSGSLSCSEISEEKIIRKSITYLQSLKSGEEPTLKEAISDLAEKLKCDSAKKGSASYEKIKSGLKRTMSVFFRHGPNSSEWEEFKAKHKKQEKESRGKTSRRSKESRGKTSRRSSSPKNLESLSVSKISSLAKMCETNKTKAEIQEVLNKNEISRIEGQPISKIKKGDLCETIEAIAPANKILPAAQPSRSEIHPDKCDTRAWTVQKLKDYIKAKGWPSAPTKATKAKICAYIDSLESKSQVQPPIAPTQATILSGQSVSVPGASSEVPEGYNDCANPRGILTKPKIRQWVIDKGWNLEPNFPGFPPVTKDKATWCSFLAGLISAHPLVSPKPFAQPEIQRSITTCLHSSDWKTVEEVERELANCPPKQACNISTRECVPEKDLIENQRPSMSLKLKNGKTAQIYARKAEQLEKLRPNLQQFTQSETRPRSPTPNSCATLTAGNKQDLIQDLSCPVKESCNLDVSKCQPEQSGQIQLSLNGKSVTGSATKIDELQKKLETSAKPKPKVMFKPGHVVYGEEEKKRQVESSAWLSQLIGESKEQPEQIPREIKPKSPTRTTSPKPTVVSVPEIEQPSEVSRLVKRLRDIRAESAQPPIRLRIAESQLSKAISVCVGIPS